MIPDTEGIHKIINTSSPSIKADIVFVHGLNGNSHSTWRYGEEGKAGHYFWPEELGKALPHCAIWSVGYAAGISGLGNPGMIIEKRAGNIASQLSNLGIGKRPVVFITHSMGGLVVKSLIIAGQLTSDPIRKQLVENISGIIFCGTPHRGSEFATAAGILAKALGGSQKHVNEMEANAEPLDLLHDHFRSWHSKHSIPIESYAESIGLFRKKLWGRPIPLGLVVPRASANPGIGLIHDVDADHLTLVKPSPAVPAIYDLVFRGAQRFIEDCIGAFEILEKSYHKSFQRKKYTFCFDKDLASYKEFEFIKLKAIKEDGSISKNIVQFLYNEIKENVLKDEIADEKGTYAITEAVMTDLKRDGVSTIVASQLKSIAGKVFASKKKFINAISILIGDTNMSKHYTAIIGASFSKSQYKQPNCLVMGDTGSGKTTVSKLVLIKLSNKTDFLPIYINLSNYTDGSLLNTKVEYLANKPTLSEVLSDGAFRKNNKIILLLDSLDRMIVGANYAEKVKIYTEIKNISSSCDATLIFARTHLFRDISEEDIIGFSKIHLLPFDRSEIVEYLSKHSKFDLQTIMVLIDDLSVVDFLKRPLLLSMVAETNIRQLRRVNNIFDLVGIYVNKWLGRELPHSIITKDKKELLLSLVAIETFNNRGKNITYYELNDIIVRTKSNITEEELDCFSVDLRTCTFLRRNTEDRFEFMHDIFYEHYTSNYLVECLKEKNVTPFSKFYLGINIITSVTDKICALNISHILAPILVDIWDKNNCGIVLSNIFELYTGIGGSLENLCFNDRIFKDFTCSGLTISDSLFSNCSFENSIFLNTTLDIKELENCKFVECTFDGTIMSNFTISHSSFNKCIFKRSHLMGGYIFNSSIADTSFQKGSVTCVIRNSKLNNLTLAGDAKLEITASEMYNVWHEQTYDFSCCRYLHNHIVNNATKFSLALLPKNARPTCDIKIDKELESGVVKNDEANVEYQRKVLDRLEHSENRKDVMMNTILLGKSKTQAKKLNRLQDKINKIRGK